MFSGDIHLRGPTSETVLLSAPSSTRLRPKLWRRKKCVRHAETHTFEMAKSFQTYSEILASSDADSSTFLRKWACQRLDSKREERKRREKKDKNLSKKSPRSEIAVNDTLQV
jgi:hypothetical protein